MAALEMAQTPALSFRSEEPSSGQTLHIDIVLMTYHLRGHDCTLRRHVENLESEVAKEKRREEKKEQTTNRIRQPNVARPNMAKISRVGSFPFAV